MTDQLIKLSAEASQLLNRKTELEIQLKDVTDQLTKLQTGALIDELLLMGLTGTTLADGTTIKQKRGYYGGISYDNGLGTQCPLPHPNRCQQCNLEAAGDGH